MAMMSEWERVVSKSEAGKRYHRFWLAHVREKKIYIMDTDDSQVAHILREKLTAGQAPFIKYIKDEDDEEWIEVAHHFGETVEEAKKQGYSIEIKQINNENVLKMF